MTATTRTAPTIISVAVGALLLTGCGSGHLGDASGSPEPLRIGAASTAAASMSSNASGRFRLDGSLPTGAETSPVFRPATVQESVVRKIAEALGTTDEPTRAAHGWRVGNAAADGPELRVRDDGVWSWSSGSLANAGCQYPAVDIDTTGIPAYAVGCAVSSGTGGPSASTTGSGGPEPLGPNAAATRRGAQALFASLGLPVADADVVVGGGTSTISIDPVVAGVPTTGIATTASVNSVVISAAQGTLTAFDPGASYPLITARDAFDQLANTPQPLMGAPESGIACRKNGAPGNTPAPGIKSMPCNDLPIVVTGATLGLTARYEDFSSLVLVPAWFFAVRNSQWPLVQIALTPSLLVDPSAPAGPGPVGTDPNPGSVAPGSIGPQPSDPAKPAPSGSLVLAGTEGTGTSLVLHAWGSPCEEYGAGAVDSTDSAVTVGIVVTKAQASDVACIEIARDVTIAVNLDAPLGSRTVMDRATGAPVPAYIAQPGSTG